MLSQGWWTAAALLSLIVWGCASNTDVVPVGKDTYVIGEQPATGLPDLGNTKAEIIKEGSRYCAGLGKEFQLVSTQATQPPYVFTCTVRAGAPIPETILEVFFTRDAA